MNNEKPIILTTITGKHLVDIIMPASATDRSILIAYLNERNIGFDLITKNDAAKLLVEHGGIGFGCYVKDNTGAETEWRMIESQLRYLDLSSYIGMLQIVPSVELDVPYRAEYIKGNSPLAIAG